MTKEEAKAEAEKIKQEYRNCIADGVYLSDDQITQCAIIKVKGIIEVLRLTHVIMDLADGLIVNEYFEAQIKKFESILRELEK